LHQQQASNRKKYSTRDMAEKITARDLAARKGDFVLVDIREADGVAEDGKIDGAAMLPGKRLKRRTNNTTMLHR
jgi:hypothetical protein